MRATARTRYTSPPANKPVVLPAPISRKGRLYERSRTGAARADLDVLAIGPRPPYIVGQSVATEALLGHLERSSLRIRAVDTAPRHVGWTWVRRLSRIPRYVRALFALAAGRKAGWVYISVDADAGVYHNILCAALARLRGSRVIAHHHNYSYITEPGARMALFCNVAGPDAVHITLCELMSRELKQVYGDAVGHTFELTNTYTVGTERALEPGLPERFTLGHLSDLRVEKGLPTVINCLRLLRRAGIDARLRLAGSVANQEAAAMIETAKEEFGGALVHEGALYGAAYDEFYRGISVFLFPTEYRNEAQPLVVLDALAAGTPVVAYGRGCISCGLGEAGGLVVPVGASFENAALPRLLEWAPDPASLGRAAAVARRRFDELKRSGEEQLQTLLALLNGGA